MVFEAIATLVLGGLCFWWGMGIGRSLVKKGITAENIFQGKNAVSLLFLGLYILLVVAVLNIPQWQGFPHQWRVYGLQVSWTLLRISLLGFCGIGFAITQKTARQQMIAILLLAILGVGAFSFAENYVLAPIYSELTNNLQPNGVFKQTSMTSCAPSALATVLRRWNILDATEVSVAKAAGTSRLGTSMPQLIQGARQFGVDGVELSPTWEQMQQMNRPGVLSVWLRDGNRKLPHAVALLAMNSERLLIGDPASGKMFLLDRAEFAKIWRKEFVPIFRRQEVMLLTVQQASEYLQRLGYTQSSEFKENLRAFQKAIAPQASEGIGIKATGTLTTETSLLLMGAFLEGVPTLKDFPL